tara:strand:+ start:192 stop:383 length:192 start_codon:yes stop_codon:yes gene_type:complete
MRRFYDRFYEEKLVEDTLAESKLIERINSHSEIIDISPKTVQQQAIKITPEIRAMVKGEAPVL